MPTKQISNTYGAYGQPLFASAGVNEQLMVEVVNNTGGPIFQGQVMCWDLLAAFNTTPALLITPAATGTIASQTVTVASSTAGYTPGQIATISNVLYPATNAGPLNNYIGNMAMVFGGLSGSTFTNAYLPFATKASGLQATSAVFMSPSASVPSFAPGGVGQGLGLPPFATASDGGRLVTFSSLISTTLVAKDPLVCGVVSPTGDAGTNGTIIHSGRPFLMCIGGVARVYAGLNVINAQAALCTAAAAVGSADDATPTLGNQLGESLENNVARDGNNTIRALIKLA